MDKSLRNVTAKCVVCGQKYKPKRRDSRYCSPACRQRSHRARTGLSDLDREIEQARLHYWNLIAQKAHALGRKRSDLLVVESQYVDEEGNIFVGGILGGGEWRFAGRSGHKGHPGFDSWGLETAGPPWSPPTHIKPIDRGYFESKILGTAVTKRNRKAAS